MPKLFDGMEETEAARTRLSGASFMSGLFHGRADFRLLFPPEESAGELARGRKYRQQLADFLLHRVDPQEIEQQAKIPRHVLTGLLELGAFGMIIPKQYGGLGFSHREYGRALCLIAGWSNSLSLTVAVPQSIGIAMPILLFGNEEQKKHYLPLVARREISAFALTEAATGSDAANVKTRAVLDKNGTDFYVQGEKLWCTNGTIARYITLIARVPAVKTIRDGRPVWVAVPEGTPAEDKVLTAFILDMHTAGVTIRERCRFEGCRGIENAYMRFSNVRIPAENVIGEIGQGLKYALTILNLGRAISVPAICLGMAKQAWQPVLDRANSRVTFGRPIGSYQTQAMRVGNMATTLFAMEALCELSWKMADQQGYDLRIEAAITKIFCSEQSIDFLNQAQIIFGGMGYETAHSKALRGEPAFGMEQLVRDATMYRIGEGATDILRPFIVREALAKHLEMIGGYLDGDKTGRARIRALFKLLTYYLPWYLAQWKRRPLPAHAELRQRPLREQLSYIERTSRKLSRTIFYALLIRRLALREDQGRHNRIAAIGEGLLAIAATALHAQNLERQGARGKARALADAYFQRAKTHIRSDLGRIIHNDDAQAAALGKQALRGDGPSLDQGVIRRKLRDYSD